jgi:hypothetical protein
MKDYWSLVVKEVEASKFWERHRGLDHLYMASHPLSSPRRSL